jgi:glycosyltransferase involved in cell wall biosynthesis
MKILVVTGTFPPRKFGGMTTVAYNLSKEMTKRGHDVTVYTTDVGDCLNLRLKVNNVENKDGMKVCYFKNFNNYLAFKHRLFLPITMFLTLRKDLMKFDIIHVHDFRSLLSILVHHYSKKYDIPYVLQAHGSIPYSSEKEFLKKIFDKLWGYNILNDASKVIALTKTEFGQYKNMGVPGDKIEIVPNGINLSEYHKLPKKGDFRKEYKIKNDEKIILYLGRLNKIKGVDLLINSFSDISKELNNVKLVIVGPDDGFLDYLKEMSKNLKLSNDIIFTGPLYKKDKIKAYVDANVYVLPSRYETFPNTIIESCACGTPVIVTDRCGISDMINNKVGIVVKFEKNSLVKGLISMLRDNFLRDKFALECVDLVQKQFNTDFIINKLESIYKSIKKGDLNN